MLKRFFAIVALAGLMTSLAAPKRADAGWAWNGHAWTLAIASAIGAAAVGYFLKYESAMLRSKGSVKQAETVMNLPLFGSSSNSWSPDPHELSLQAIRGIVLSDVIYEMTVIKNPAAEIKWRAKFETLRSCWNDTLVTPATSSPSASPSPTTSAASASAQSGATSGASKPTKGKAPKTSSAITLRVVAYDADRTSSDAAGWSPEAKNSPAESSPSPSASATPREPTCTDLFAQVVANYPGDVAKAGGKPPSGESADSNTATKETPSPDASAQALAFRTQTQIDSRDLVAYLSTSPSLLAQVTKENVGTYVTDDYVRNLFLGIAAIQFVDALPTPPSNELSLNYAVPSAGPSAPEKTLLSDCAGVTSVTSGIQCLADVGSVESAYEGVHVARETCYWSKHVIMPTFSDIELWANKRGPYDPRFTGLLGRSSTPPPSPNALIVVPTPAASSQTISPSQFVIEDVDDVTVHDATEAALKADMTVLTVLPNC
jgi:hypothetical protein